MKIAECKVCKKEFKYKSNRAGKFCSFECYKKKCSGKDNHNYKNGGKKYCINCQKEYISYDKKRRYCSQKCYWRYSWPTHKCGFCGNEFKSPEKKAKMRFCNVNCKSSYQKEKYKSARIDKVCPICNIKFKVILAFEKQTCCSFKCSYKRKKVTMRGKGNFRYIDGKSKSRYRGYDWAEQREKAFIRDEGRCQECGYDQERIAVHHAIPYRICKHNNLSNLICLCTSCHAIEESYFRQFSKPSENVRKFLRKLCGGK